MPRLALLASRRTDVHPRPRPPPALCPSACALPSVCALFASCQQDATPLATHAPLSLLPSPFPRSAFEHARALQPHFNRLVHAISRDHAFLDDVVSSLAGVDEFTGALYRIYKDAEAAPGPRQVRILCMAALSVHGPYRHCCLKHTRT